MFSLMMHSTHFFNGYNGKVTQIKKEETCCHHYMGNYFLIIYLTVFLSLRILSAHSEQAVIAHVCRGC